MRLAKPAVQPVSDSIPLATFATVGMRVAADTRCMSTSLRARFELWRYTAPLDELLGRDAVPSPALGEAFEPDPLAENPVVCHLRGKDSASEQTAQETLAKTLSKMLGSTWHETR